MLNFDFKESVICKYIYVYILMEVQDKLNIIPKYFKNILYDTESNKIKLIIIFVLIAASIAYLHGIIKENIINGTSILIMVIALGTSYLYIKKSYSKKYKIMKNKIDSLSKPTTLDNLCKDSNINNNENNRKVCTKYINQKKTFYEVSDYLLKKYKY